MATERVTHDRRVYTDHYIIIRMFYTEQDEIWRTEFYRRSTQCNVTTEHDNEGDCVVTFLALITENN